MDNEVWRPVKRKTHAGFTWEFVPPDKLEGMMQAWDAASGHGHSR